MSTTTSFTVTGAASLTKRLEKATNAAKYGVVNLLRAHAAGLQRQTTANLGAGSYRVKDLTPDYKKRKRKQYGKAMPVFVATGKLMRALRARVHRRAKGVYGFRYSFPGTSRKGTPLGVIGAVNFNLRPQARALPYGWKSGVIQSVRDLIKQQREQR